ncbi:MAG: hypothetical protein Q8O64_20275 [Sideroxyarcus sp.]|nr:hypothetical protein [Sideroxyarcus sp.]
MLTLPSMWNVLISTIVFFVAVWAIRRYLEEQGIPKGMTRGLLVFVLAYLPAWGVGEIVDWVVEKIEGPQATQQRTDEAAELLKALGQTRP